MTSVIEPNGVDAVKVPINNEFAVDNSEFIFTKRNGIVTMRVVNIKAASTVGSFQNAVGIPLGFRPSTNTRFLIKNLNSYLDDSIQKTALLIILRTDGTISFYNYVASTQEFNIEPIDFITYIAAE